MQRAEEINPFISSSMFVPALEVKQSESVKLESDGKRQQYAEFVLSAGLY